MHKFLAGIQYLSSFVISINKTCFRNVYFVDSLLVSTFYVYFRLKTASAVTQFNARFARLVRLARSYGQERRDLASLKLDPGKPGWPASHMNEISEMYENSI